MNTKNLVILGGVAAVLGIAAALVGGGSKTASPKLNGVKAVGDFNVADVAAIEFGDRLKLSAGDDGWKVDTYHGYPADRSKIADNLLKLTELKVGQTVRGKKLEKTEKVVLKDAKGGELAALPLGERHAKWGHGRYALVKGETVLVNDQLDAFDADPKKWIETKIVDEPWISFNELATLTNETEYGFATGVVAKVTIAGDTNRTITVGNVVKGGSDRYIKLDNSRWVYQVSSYSVDKFLPKPAPKEEKKVEPAKKEEPGK